MQILEGTNLKALARARKMGAEGVINLLEKKGLVGRGGAAFPTAKKWRMAMQTNADARFIICNADEGEPGTFKDKFILQNNAKTMLEGMLICAYTIGAKECFIYLRGEYEYLKDDLQKQIDEVIASAQSDVSIQIVLGAGAYICGEETAIIQSIMGFRGQAMFKPPYPTIEGLWGKPTVVNNVETFTCAAQAILFDNWNPNMRLFCLSGNVTNPGIFEFPLGTELSTLIKLAKPKYKLKAMSFGCFGGIMPINSKMKITTESICKEDCQHGAFSVVLIDEKQNVLDICCSIARFYTYESCGKCTPCREGTIRMLNLLKKVKSREATNEDLKLIAELANHIQRTSLCGLGQSSGNHVLTALKHFPQDFEAYVK
ncbi:MAG: NADH-ubiquinone oxidoreductase-F iron-sulfur binding region domain-containing protein [Candidatus Micrarchaeia archaeon]